MIILRHPEASTIGLYFRSANETNRKIGHDPRDLLFQVYDVVVNHLCNIDVGQ
jgi:hypothetical protein